MKHKRRSVKEKKQILLDYFSGKTLNLISKEYHTCSNDILVIVERYKLYGEKGLSMQLGYRGFTLEEKIEILSEITKFCILLPALSVKYGVSLPTIRKWQSQYQSGNLLGDNMKNNKTVISNSKKSIQSDIESNIQLIELKKLRKENEELKIQLELLKKVKALVKTAESAERLHMQESSKN